ncbi:hypothetical protein BFP76_03955 [Amylibacter kogurei]|uniref:Glycosyl transferase family 2 n=1 Tax=Paramylibacter kogurei TaxID=1889778 RepID=A0A2G5K4B9_9RHOB|nr:glycosyltransferase family 2 protein [Amylibacter kogurei]PIB24376.1 hypothetical protein BFP76_03955 [Amylibacter kogurei]
MITSLITSIKDEAPYIIDWVAHYRALGFDHIVIFQNDSVDGSNNLCSALQDAGFIDYYDNTNPEHAPKDIQHFPAQRRAYGWGQLLDKVAQSDYMFLADIDEYLELSVDDTFSDLMARVEHPDIISFAWRMFGSAGQTSFAHHPVCERFTRAAEISNNGNLRAFKQVKSAFKPPLTNRFNVHRPLNATDHNWRWVTPDGRNINLSANVASDFDYSYAQLRHYHCKSRAEFMVKMLRGYASHGNKKLPQIGLPAFHLMDANDVELPFENQAYQRGRMIAQEMREIPAIKTAEDDAIARFEKLAGLVEKAINKNDIFKQAATFHADLTQYFQTEVYDKL